MYKKIRSICILRRRKLESKVGLSRATIYAKLDENSPSYDPTFPKPIPLGGRAVGWVEDEVDEWLAAQIEKSEIQRDMKRSNATRSKVAFRRDQLPNPSDYYREQGLTLYGCGEWKSAICPFHDDTNPSFRVRIDTGAFRCMACGAHGGDVLAFHMQRHGLRFIESAKALGAWEGEQ